MGIAFDRALLYGKASVAAGRFAFLVLITPSKLLPATFCRAAPL